MAREERSYDLPYNTVFRACRKAIRTLNWGVSEVDEEEGSIEAKISSSLRSWGEVIEIYVSDKEDEIIVEVESTPSAQLFDWGKSDENLDEFFNELEDILGV